MNEGLHLPTTVRERAVEAVLSGIAKSTVARAYGVSRLTVYRWLDRFAENGATGSNENREVDALANWRS